MHGAEPARLAELRKERRKARRVHLGEVDAAARRDARQDVGAVPQDAIARIAGVVLLVAGVERELAEHGHGLPCARRVAHVAQLVRKEEHDDGQPHERAVERALRVGVEHHREGVRADRARLDLVHLQAHDVADDARRVRLDREVAPLDALDRHRAAAEVHREDGRGGAEQRDGREVELVLVDVLLVGEGG